MVLVYGAEGLLGDAICRRLREHGTRVRALVSRNTPAPRLDALRRLNTEVFPADFREPPAIAAACSGAQAVICADPAMLPSGNGSVLEPKAVRCLVEFASALAVRHFIFVTVPERFETACALTEARKECRARLAAHGMNYVMLETGFFMETWLGPSLGFDHANGRAMIFGTGTRPIAWVSCYDVAEVAVRCVGVDHRRKRRLEVAAPENVSPHDVVRMFEDAGGTAMEVAAVPEEDLREQYRRAADPSSRVLAAMKIEYSLGLPMKPDCDDLPLSLTSVREYCRRAVGQGAEMAGSG